MATIVGSAAGGNWNATAAWVGGVVPGSGDDVQLNATSGPITINVAAACRSLDCTGYTGTLTHAAAVTLTIGDATAGLSSICLKFVAGMTYSPGSITTSSIILASTSATQQTITTAGKRLPAFTVNNGTGNYIQVDDLTSGGSLSMGSATYDTTTNSVKIILDGNGAAFGSSGKTYFEVDFTGGGIAAVNGANTFTNLKRVGTAAKTDSFQFSGTSTVTGTLTLQGNSAINRLLVQSNVVGTQRTITCNGTITASNVDFQDIVGAGSASWNLAAITGNSGDAGNNSGITFTTSAQQTWSGTLGGNWSTNPWSGRVPLPQDDVVINAAFSASQTISVDMPRAGRSVNWTGATGTPQFNMTTGTRIYGSLTLISGMIVAGTAAFIFAARSGSWTITSAGKTIAASVNIGDVASTSTYTLQDAFSSSQRLTITSKLVTQGFSLTLSVAGTAALVTSAGSVLDLGSSTVTLSGNTAANILSLNTSTVINATGSTIVLSSPSTATRTVTGGAGNSLGAFTYTVAASPGAVQFSNASSWQSINIGSGRQLILPNGVTTTVAPGGWNVSGNPYGYEYLPGVAANYLSVPDAAPLKITGNLTIDGDIAPSTWTPAAATMIAAKWAVAGQFSYRFYINTVGNLVLEVGTDGSTTAATIISTAAVGFGAGVRRWVRVSFQPNDGSGNRVTNFYTSTDGSTWTQLGSTITSVGALTTFNGTSVLEIGSDFLGTAGLFTGNIYRIRVYNANLLNGSGTPVFDADLTSKKVGANTFAESSSNAATVTINGVLAQAGDGRVAITSASPGTQATVSSPSGTVTTDYLTLQDSAATGGALWLAGLHSTNVSNNTGWIFGAPVSTHLTMTGMGA